MNLTLHTQPGDQHRASASPILIGGHCLPSEQTIGVTAMK
nr:MAG TPA: hypothetical protein [Caudoviricetes sp.]